MRRKTLIALLSAIGVATPVSAATPAPPGTPATRYCMRVGPLTGSNVETVQCWTRAEWADQGVDVDREWAKEGVGVIA
jgi:hypothetical protein